MFKRFVPQKPMSPIEKESTHWDKDDKIRLTSREELKTSTIHNYQKPMAEHGGKDILSSDGEINSEGVLTIGENANIRGEIKAKAVTVYGKVQGNITVAERCELKAKSTLQGDLKATRLTIEDGATFIGKSEVTTGPIPAAKPGSTRPEVVRHEEPVKAAFGGRG